MKIKKLWYKFRFHFRTQRFARYLRPWMPARPRWQKILKGESFDIPTQAKRILIATSTGAHWPMSGFESVIAAALKIRGAEVEALLCDGALPACQECDLRLFPENKLLTETTKPLCKTCYKPARTMFTELNMPVIAYSEWLTAADRSEITAFLQQTQTTDLALITWRGIPVGEHALAGTLRFFGRGNLNGEVYGAAIARQYLHAALITTAALQRLFQSNRYDAVVFHHGIYVPQGIIGDVCRQQNIPVINWHPAYRKQTYLFSHGDTYHKTMIAEPCEQWEKMPWNADKEKAVMDYLDSRCHGRQDWISYQHTHHEAPTALKSLGLNPHLPTIGLLTNVMWDAQLHFRHNAFSSMLAWLLFSIDYFIRRPELQLLIRIHPAEVLGGVPSRQRVEDEIKSHFKTLPKNICIVASTSPLNTYALMQQCDSALVYGTKMAIELPCWGMPVIVAGEAWARGKGFTRDVSSVAEYQAALDALPYKTKIDESSRTRARQYAYHFFNRRMIPVKFAKRYPRLVPFAYEIPSLDVLKPGADPGLDAICDGILTGKPFIYDQAG